MTNNHVSYIYGAYFSRSSFSSLKFFGCFSYFNAAEQNKNVKLAKNKL